MIALINDYLPQGVARVRALAALIGDRTRCPPLAVAGGAGGRPPPLHAAATPVAAGAPARRSARRRTGRSTASVATVSRRQRRRKATRGRRFRRRAGCRAWPRRWSPTAGRSRSPPRRRSQVANAILDRAKAKAPKLLANAAPYTEPVTKGESTLYRARFAGFETKDAARKAAAPTSPSKISPASRCNRLGN